MIHSAYPHRVIDRESLNGIDYSNEAPLDGLAAALADQNETDRELCEFWGVPAVSDLTWEASFKLARVLA